MIKKQFFDFCTQVMLVFAYIIILLNIFCMLWGDGAKQYTIFSLGSAGLSVSTVFQFFFISIIIVGIRTLFMSDFLINKMSYVLRNLSMLILIFIVVIIFVITFSWFPVGQGMAWMTFLICYGLSFVLSLIVSTVKINMENKRLTDALEQLKKENNREDY